MSDVDQDTPKDPNETDERFPSGEWKGFWLQRSLSAGTKGWMELVLSFRDGGVQGEGRDRYGSFTIRGRYDLESGEVTFNKAYAWYDIFYKGYAELDKGIWGLWELPDDRDGFHIWPKGMADPTQSRLEEEADVPAEQEKPVLVGQAG